MEQNWRVRAAAESADERPIRFPIRVEPRYRGILRIFGVRPDNAYAELGETIDARFGWSRITTPIANCVGWSIEGPWRALTAIGVRRSIRHGDVTFGGSPRGGVRIDFRERPAYFFFRPPALYLTVEDLEGFAAALTAKGIPGQDRRRTRARVAR
jgi:hypothetical protein